MSEATMQVYRCARCNAPFEIVGGRRYEIDDSGSGAYICFICHDRAAASAWAKRLLDVPNAVIFDTETTGLDETDQIVEISIINVAGETLLDTLVKPTIRIPVEATIIHGLKDDDVAGAPTWAEIDAQVIGLLRDAPFIAVYNLEYDARMIRQTRAAHGLPTLDTQAIYRQGDRPKTRCAMKLYAKWVGEWSRYHGNYKWQRLDGGHRALGDCLATLEKIKEMAKESPNA